MVTIAQSSAAKKGTGGRAGPTVTRRHMYSKNQGCDESDNSRQQMNQQHAAIGSPTTSVTAYVTWIIGGLLSTR